jgi:cytoskeletal protein CcmA (bactofilin family)
MWNRESAPPPVAERSPAAPVAERSAAAPAAERGAVASVGKSVRFKGTIFSSEELVIDGHVEGTIEVKNSRLSIGPEADIHADIAAGTVTILGSVTGNIRAEAKIEVGATGRADGDLVAPCIVLTDGAIVCGRVDTLRAEAEGPPQLAIA